MSQFALFSINQQIEKLRKEMIKLAGLHGIRDPIVIKCSQDLDELILKVQAQASKKIG